MKADPVEPQFDVTVIVPVRNAENTIGRCLDSILAQTTTFRMEILVVDGQSEDRTREKVRTRSSRDGRIRLLDNPRRRVSPALNLGLREARGEYIVRLDAHSLYAPDYIQCSLDLLRERNVEAVGGIQVPAPSEDSPMARAIAAAQGSPFAFGGAAHRRAGYEGPARTLWLGAFRRDLARQVGGFNEALFRSEDNEFFQRIRANGGRLLISSDIRARYLCRSSLSDLARQYWVTGTEILPTLARNPRAMALRHFVPGLAGLLGLATVLVGLTGGGAAHWSRTALMLLAGSYTLALLTSAARCAWRGGPDTFPRLLLVFPVIHLTYALGTLAGLGKALNIKLRPQATDAT